MFQDIITNFGVFVGFAALVSLIINVLKFFGVVKDGTADKWVAGFNLVGIITIYVLKLIMPDYDPMPVDSVLAEVAIVGGFIFQYVVMILGSKLTYLAFKGLPLIGKSNSG